MANTHGNWIRISLISLILLLTACEGGDSPTTQEGNPNSATLTWDANSESNLAGYSVYYGTSPGIYIQAKGEGINVGNTTTYQVIDLQVGSQYYFAVTAYDTSGNESDYSDEVSKAIP